MVFYYEQTNPIKRLINLPGRVILLDAKSLDCLNEVNISRFTWSYLLLTHHLRITVRPNPLMILKNNLLCVIDLLIMGYCLLSIK